jgi:hypothetical protein
VGVVSRPHLGGDAGGSVGEGGSSLERPERPGELNGSRGVLVQAQDGFVAAHEVTRVRDHGREDVRGGVLVRDLQEHVVEGMTFVLPALEVGNELGELDRAGQLVADVLKCARGEAVGRARADGEPELHPANGHGPGREREVDDGRVAATRVVRYERG